MDNIATQINESFDLLLSKLLSWMDSIVLSLPNIILVLITFFIGLKLIKLGRKIVSKIAAKKVSSQGVRNLMDNVVSVISFIILIVVLLSILGLKGPLATILASAGVAGLALGLALQDPLMNLFSGVIMNVKRDFDVDDFVETNGYIGKVETVSLNTTIVKLLSGEQVNLPNKLVLQHPVKNFTTNPLRRIEIQCGISYGDDLEKVKQVTTSAVAHLSYKDVARPVEFIYTSFGTSSIDFELRIWIKAESIWHYLDTKSDAIISIKKAFNANDITIPFPIRTLDFGIKGGVPLTESFPDGAFK